MTLKAICAVAVSVFFVCVLELPAAGAEAANSAEDVRAFCDIDAQYSDGTTVLVISDLFLPSQLPENWDGSFKMLVGSKECDGFSAAVVAHGFTTVSTPALVVFTNAEAGKNIIAGIQSNKARIPWKAAPTALASQRKKKTVLFRPAHGNERGYRGVTFDIEYKFIVCSGELHIAYSIVEDSVRKAPRDIGRDLYSLGGHLYEVSEPPKAILNLPLKGRVFYSFLQASTIGTFADDNAGKALGFGCFSGQSQKIADVKDLRDENGGQPSKEYLPKLLDLLDVSFETTQVLTSAEAEDEIRAGNSKAATAKDEHANKAAQQSPQADQGPSEADLRAQRRAQEEAEFQAKEKAYEEGMAEHQAAVDQYQKALADMEAQKAANAAAAKAQQEEFARKQAEYEAEAAKAKQAQDEYEAKYGKPQ